MGAGAGLAKYVFFTPLTIVGFISMYVFGGAIITLFNTLGHLFAGNFIAAFIEYFLNSALPPSSIGQVLIQVVVGALVAGSKWFIAMIVRGTPV